MKRFLAAAALLVGLALAAPVSAATSAQIPGTGTGGNVGLHPGSGSTAVATLNTAIPAGSFVAFAVDVRTTSGTNSVSSCVDSKSNTYAFINAIAINANSGLCYGTITTALTTSDTVTANFNVSGLNDIIVGAWTNPNASPLDGSPTLTNGAGTSMNLGSTPTLTLGGSNELVISLEGMDTGGSQTDAGGWTALGTSGSNQLHMAFQLVTATTPVTNTVTSTVSNTWSGILAAFKSASSGGGVVYHGLASAGAGR